MARTSERELEARGVRVLECLRDMGADVRPVGVSRAALARELGLTLSRLHRSLTTLLADGMLEVRPLYLPDGGQQVNEYRITPRGRRWLAARSDARPSEGGAEEESEGRCRGWR